MSTSTFRQVLVGCLLVAAAFWLVAAVTPQEQAQPAPATVTPSDLMSVPEGKAVVYFFNSMGHVLFGTGRTFKMDGRDVVKQSREEYSEAIVEPGMHKFEAAGEKLTVDVQAGRHYFVTYAYSPGKSWAGGLAGKSTVFGELPEEKACELLAAYKHVELPVKR